MKVIWKYQLRLIDEIQEVEMPEDAEIIHVANQHNTPTMWVLVTPWAHPNMIKRRFVVYGTGHSIKFDEALDYRGTALTDDDESVWHIFEVKS